MSNITYFCFLLAVSLSPQHRWRQPTTVGSKEIATFYVWSKLSFFNKSGMWWLNVYLTFLTDEYMITVCLTVVDQTVPWMTKRINNVCAFFTLFSLPTLPPQSIFPMVQGNHFVPIWVSDGHQMSSHPKNNTFATDSSII